MRLDDAASDQSSSSISSPPTSPQNSTFASDTIRVAHPHPSNPDIRRAGGVANPSPATSAPPLNLTNATSLHHANAAAHASNGSTSTPPAKVKRPRKKKELGADGKPVDDGKPPKEKKPRKPREPKDKTAASAATTSRKKIKSEDKPAPDASSSSSSQPRQSTLTELVHTYPQSMTAPNNAVTPIPSHTYTDGSLRPNLLSHTSSSTPTPRPFSSGQNYDPVRSATIDPNPHRVVQSLAGPASVQASAHVNRASASPSIASLIDPPVNSKPSSHTTHTTSHSPNLAMQHPIVPSQPHSPTPAQKSNGSSAQSVIPTDKSPSMAESTPVAISNLDGAMDLDVKTKPQQSGKSKALEVKDTSKGNSTSHTPKNNRPTPPPAAPKTAGTGLLASSDLFGGATNIEATERRGVNIDLHIKLDPAGGNSINIAQEILHKYGHDAINPRAAAHRQHLLQVAAAAKKIGDGSPDDMSVDLSDMDDSNVEMGGMDDTTNSAQPADGEKPRKRRKKVEEYDKEDDFIDDTELAWQEQAAVTKDGFFVYSGPLIPPGEAARVETSAPTRGRGRGRGRRAGAAAAGTTHASLAEKKDPGVAPTLTGRGRGGRARGTGTTRKPRITKADRERMEIEKKERERSAAATAGSSVPAAQPTLAMKSMGASA